MNVWYFFSGSIIYLSFYELIYDCSVHISVKSAISIYKVHYIRIIYTDRWDSIKSDTKKPRRFINHARQVNVFSAQQQANSRGLYVVRISPNTLAEFRARVVTRSSLARTVSDPLQKHVNSYIVLLIYWPPESFKGFLFYFFGFYYYYYYYSQTNHFP